MKLSFKQNTKLNSINSDRLKVLPREIHQPEITISLFDFILGQRVNVHVGHHGKWLVFQVFLLFKLVIKCDLKLFLDVKELVIIVTATGFEPTTT